MFVNIEGLDEKTISGVRSGDYTLLAEDGEITSDGILKLAAGGNLALSKMEKSRGPAATARAHHGDTAEDEDQQQRGSRELNSMRSNAIKQRRVLAVRVRASDSVTTASDAVLSDKIFGTNGDSNNLRERFATCSYGETQMIPFNGRTRTGVSILNGVYSVAINRRVTSVEEGVIRDAVSDALTRELGDLPSQFDHVMLCLPPKTNGDWIGYGKYQKLFHWLVGWLVGWFFGGDSHCFSWWNLSLEFGFPLDFTLCAQPTSVDGCPSLTMNGVPSHHYRSMRLDIISAFNMLEKIKRVPTKMKSVLWGLVMATIRRGSVTV